MLKSSPTPIRGVGRRAVNDRAIMDGDLASLQGQWDGRIFAELTLFTFEEQDRVVPNPGHELCLEVSALGSRELALVFDDEAIPIRLVGRLERSF